MIATPLGYQWRFNGASVSGATSSAYTRANLQAGDAGSYSVVVTNAGGGMTSSNALLTGLPSQSPRFDMIALLPDGRVKLLLAAESGFNYTIQASSNRVNGFIVTNVLNAPGLFEFVDANATNSGRRFYRASSP